MTKEYAELYSQLVQTLKETVPTTNKELEAAHCKKLMEFYSNGIVARSNGGRKVAGDKKSGNAEIEQIKNDILEPLNKIIPAATVPIAIALYKAMMGDYCRYITEYLTDHDKSKKTHYFDAALSAFLMITESTTSSGINITHPLYLELHLSLAKLYYATKMYRFARVANVLASLTVCKADMDGLDEESRKQSNEIRERMRKLMTRWTDETLDGYTDEIHI
ncbi:hypothetical protein BGW39_010302 [Mortierella sp. 14UC]|nr:hypothetical protein BGW39_010302 [Mortierella sp. 14UC]